MVQTIYTSTGTRNSSNQKKKTLRDTGYGPNWKWIELKASSFQHRHFNSRILMLRGRGFGGMELCWLSLSDLS
jgi:hypothetical protein